jgi:hypothetical protein
MLRNAKLHNLKERERKKLLNFSWPCIHICEIIFTRLYFFFVTSNQQREVGEREN